MPAAPSKEPAGILFSPLNDPSYGACKLFMLQHPPACERGLVSKPRCVLALLLCFSSIAVLAQSVPAAIYTDPTPDAVHPAAMAVLHIPSHGVLINGILYSPPGSGPHPTIVICHGLPGNEKNLDLAQALRRAGWNAVTFNYRGSWGSPGYIVLRRISKTPMQYLLTCAIPPMRRSSGSIQIGSFWQGTAWAAGSQC